MIRKLDTHHKITCFCTAEQIMIKASEHFIPNHRLFVQKWDVFTGFSVLWAYFALLCMSFLLALICLKSLPKKTKCGYWYWNNKNIRSDFCYIYWCFCEHLLSICIYQVNIFLVVFCLFVCFMNCVWSQPTTSISLNCSVTFLHALSN